MTSKLRSEHRFAHVKKSHSFPTNALDLENLIFHFNCEIENSENFYEGNEKIDSDFFPDTFDAKLFIIDQFVFDYVRAIVFESSTILRNFLSFDVIRRHSKSESFMSAKLKCNRLES